MNANPNAQNSSPQRNVSKTHSSEDVHRLPRTGEPGFQGHEAGLHEEDEERGDQDPDGVDGVHQLVRLVRHLLRRRGRVDQPEIWLIANSTAITPSIFPAKIVTITSVSGHRPDGDGVSSPSLPSLFHVPWHVRWHPVALSGERMDAQFRSDVPRVTAV